MPLFGVLRPSPYDTGDTTVQQIAELFGVPRTTVYGYLTKTNQ